MPTTDGPTVLDTVPLAPRTGRVSRLLDRSGVTSVLARDTLLAAVVLLVTAALMAGMFQFVLGTEGLTVGPVQGVVLTVAACLQAAPLALRRVRPLLCLGLVVACQVLIIAASPDDLSVGGLPQIIAGYTIGTLLPTRRALAVTSVAAPVAALAAAATALATGNELLVPVANHLVSALLTYTVSALIGGGVAMRRNYVELLRLRAVEAVRTQEATTRTAIVAERSRMARELHDVAAHHLSGLVVQAAAVERQIDVDPEAAKAGAAWIRRQGKETLDNLRLTVGVLRERPGTDDEAYDAPSPGLSALDALARTARGLGGEVDLVRDGRERALAPIADAAFYRVVQEALSNARQHAPGAPVHIAVRFGEREVSLAVVNGPARALRGPIARDPARQGMGLTGMRERAHLVGATLTTGVTPDGGWQVLLTLPLQQESAHAATEPGSVTSGAVPASGEGGEA